MGVTTMHLCSQAQARRRMLLVAEYLVRALWPVSYFPGLAGPSEAVARRSNPSCLT